jgi:hypothetical protein
MAHRITEKTLDNLARILSRTLGRPEKPYRDNKAQIGNIHISNSGCYGYSIHRMGNHHGGISSLSDGMTAKEAYAWLQGALAVCRETGTDGPIAERWDGRSVRTNGIAVLVKYVGPTTYRGSRWQAKDKGGRGTVYGPFAREGRGTVYGPFADGPIAAAILWAKKVGLSNTIPRHVMGLSPDLYAVEF